MDGFYAAYLAGAIGNSMALFVFRDGRITGVDVGGLQYDGTYELDEERAILTGTIKYIIKAGRQLITGASAGDVPIEINFPLELPQGFADGRIVEIQSPSGAVNARFEKLRGI